MTVEVVPGELESEARFVAPTELCPHPERWTSTDSESTEEEVCALVYGLVRGLQPDACLETGTAFGAMAERISDALLVNGRGILYTVECDAGRVEYTRARLRSRRNVALIHGDTLARWEKNWVPPEGTVFDFAWFDSWYRLRVPEFRHYRPFMRKGSIVGFHDTAPGHGATHPSQDSIRATISRELRKEIRLIHLPTPRGVTLGEVL